VLWCVIYYKCCIMVSPTNTWSWNHDSVPNDLVFVCLLPCILYEYESSYYMQSLVHELVISKTAWDVKRCGKCVLLLPGRYVVISRYDVSEMTMSDKDECGVKLQQQQQQQLCDATIRATKFIFLPVTTTVLLKAPRSTVRRSRNAILSLWPRMKDCRAVVERTAAICLAWSVGRGAPRLREGERNGEFLYAVSCCCHVCTLLLLLLYGRRVHETPKITETFSTDHCCTLLH